jgi:glucosylceramidase
MKIPSTFTLCLAAVSLLAALQPARGQTVSVWLTTDDQTRLLQAQAALSFSTNAGGTNCMAVDETQTYQQIEGFGAAFTDSTGYNLNEVAQAIARTNAMNNLFTRGTGGIGLSFMRIPMGASDLARYQYSYDDLPAGQTDTNLTSFSIAHDLADIIPLILMAKQLNPQLKLFANPWSPPGWMKTNGSMVGGALLTNMYTPFANYFVKFVQDYQFQGVSIDYIGLQNEPLNETSDYPGMYMDAPTQTTLFHDYVLPAFTANHLTNRFLVYDHNWDQPGYPQTVYSDATLAASSQIAGTAWHGYAGTPGAMLTLANQYPAKGNYETEHSGGTWVGDQVHTDFDEIIQVMRSWGKTFVKWNLAGDQNDGPHDGGCGTCSPLIIVNTNSGAGHGSISYGIEYYTLGQFSKFVLPGAYRIYSANGVGVVSAAFLNPDGSKALVAFNETSGANTFQVQWGNRTFTYTLPGYSAATFTWTGTPTGTAGLNLTNEIDVSSFYSVSNLETESTGDTPGGYDVGYVSPGNYALFQNVNLGEGFTTLNARLASAGSGGTLAFYLDSPTGPMAGSVTVPITGGWQTWQTQPGSVIGGTGVHNLYAVVLGGYGVGNLNWFQFGGALPALPSPWATADVGAVGLAGGASWSNGVFTLNGSGADIWNNADAFRGVQQPVAGACEIRAQVASVLATDPWAKAGVMFRESTNAGAVNATVLVTPGNGVTFQSRSSTGGSSTSTTAGGVNAPRWVRLARSAANSFSAYYSSDGANWTQVGSSTTLTISNSIYAGMVVTAHNNASNCVAVFNNVTVNQAPVLASVSNETILAGRVLTVTNAATDADIPAQTLTYELVAAPAGATLNTNSGLFSWRPAIAQSPSSQIVTISVTDDGVPPMSATQSFTATVTQPRVPGLNSPLITNGQFGFWINGDAGPDYTVQMSTNLTAWSAVATVTPSALPWFWSATNSLSFPICFFRTLLGP